ncbi:MAG: hypothetical protein M3258_00145 [Thermoproteota archaeon]|nr:hypothetical protein [Thermoproteota archaeon]
MSVDGKPKFSSAEVNLVLHATEDGDKVLQAIQDVLLVPAQRFSNSPSEGHHKNKIVLLKAILSSEEAGNLANRIMALLNASDRDHLARSVAHYADEKGNLYLRVDKQRVCQGRLSLSETDAIRIRFRPIKRYKKSAGAESYINLFQATSLS